MRKYQIDLNNRITLRAKEELIKTESFGSQKQEAEFSLCIVIFAIIAKFRYHSENSAIAKIENFTMIEIFAMIAKILYDSEISLSLRKFRYAIEKLLIFYCCFLYSLAYISSSSSLLFLHPSLDEIDENSYELGINQHNFDAKLDIMVKVYKTCKTTKNNLETKSVVLIGPAHVNRLN